MRVVSLVSCIFLLTFAIFLLPMAAQAEEYREINKEVNASDISMHIENGDDIVLDNCSIVGELNVNSIKLKTIPNLTIESNITITNSTFLDNVSFSNVKFNHSINFSSTNITGDADFNYAIFNGNAYFVAAIFNSYTDFSYANFNSGANFPNAKFKDYVVFSYVNITGDADFSNANFNGVADLCSVNYNGKADFSFVNFNDVADFANVNFNGCANFCDANFNGDTSYFSNVSFNGDVYLWQPETSDNIIFDGKTCKFFIDYYNNEAQYEDADNVYYNYRKYVHDQKALNDLSKWTNILSWITCGYGVRLSHTICCVGFIIGFFAVFIYWPFSGAYLESKTKKWSILALLEALLFSTREFTSLGSGEPPKGIFCRAVVTLEGLFGWIMLGIFMSTLTHVVMRF
jgi:uncharacterized protein YjbI with pentapeptide repeats